MPADNMGLMRDDMERIAELEKLAALLKRFENLQKALPSTCFIITHSFLTGWTVECINRGVLFQTLAYPKLETSLEECLDEWEPRVDSIVERDKVRRMFLAHMEKGLSKLREEMGNSGPVLCPTCQEGILTINRNDLGSAYASILCSVCRVRVVIKPVWMFGGE